MKTLKQVTQEIAPPTIRELCETIVNFIDLLKLHDGKHGGCEACQVVKEAKMVLFRCTFPYPKKDNAAEQSLEISPALPDRKSH